MRKNIGWLWLILSLLAAASCVAYAYNMRLELNEKKLHSLLLLSACFFAMFFHAIGYLKKLNGND